MKNNIVNIQSPIIYQGMVETIQQIGDTIIDKKQHNAGGEMMSLFFAKAISGNYSISDLPSYIDLVDGEGNSLLSKRVFLQSRQYFNDKGFWQATFSCYISKGMLKSSVVEIPESVYLRLFNSATSLSQDEYFAQTQLTNVTINNESNLVVSWSLGIIPPETIATSPQQDELDII